LAENTQEKTKDVLLQEKTTTIIIIIRTNSKAKTNGMRSSSEMIVPATAMHAHATTLWLPYFHSLV
jgi:hypothetical protein